MRGKALIMKYHAYVLVFNELHGKLLLRRNIKSQAHFLHPILHSLDTHLTIECKLDVQLKDCISSACATKNKCRSRSQLKVDKKNQEKSPHSIYSWTSASETCKRAFTYGFPRTEGGNTFFQVASNIQFRSFDSKFDKSTALFPIWKWSHWACSIEEAWHLQQYNNRTPSLIAFLIRAGKYGR